MGKRVIAYEMMFNRVRNGRLAETWAMTDGDEFYEQIADRSPPEGLDNLG
jgi:predicted ester cyclase